MTRVTGEGIVFWSPPCRPRWPTPIRPDPFHTPATLDQRFVQVLARVVADAAKGRRVPVAATGSAS